MKDIKLTHFIIRVNFLSIRKELSIQIIKTSVIENIKHNFEELFPAEKKTAQYILDHLEEVTLLNISQLAKKAHASEASIVRMAKHLGYNGFFQMRLLLSNDVA